jgi:NAD(P)-dependent dehydrogenase (short-subunit alcohol dehydrogenase family)
MDEVKLLGRRSIGIEADITNKESASQMVDQILKEFGRIDILVNNAGGSQIEGRPQTGGSAAMTEENFRFIVDLNLMGTLFCCQAAIPFMTKQKWGRIVNFSSLQGVMVRLSDQSSFATRSAYGAAKAGITQYTRLLASELGPHGIRVNCVAPAAIATGRVLKYSREGRVISESGMRECPLGRAGTPEDIAKVVEFLCTDLSSYITGQCIRVDGGRTLF